MPPDSRFHLTDVVPQNPNGDLGQAQLLRNGDVLYEFDLGAMVTDKIKTAHRRIAVKRMGVDRPQALAASAPPRASRSLSLKASRRGKNARKSCSNCA